MKICQGDGDWAFYFAAKKEVPPAVTWEFEDISTKVGLVHPRDREVDAVTGRLAFGVRGRRDRKKSAYRRAWEEVLVVVASL